MRALNEGDTSISNIVRASDPALTRIDATGSRCLLLEAFGEGQDDLPTV